MDIDVVMARAKRIYILIFKVNRLFSFFSLRCFLKEIENMYSVFLSSYTNTSESLGEREMLWEHEPQASVSAAFSSYNSIETRSTCSLFLLENTATRKMKNNFLTLNTKMQILFAHAITTSIARASSVSPSSYTNMIFNQSARVLS